MTKREEYKMIIKRGIANMTINDIKTAINLYDSITGKQCTYGQFVSKIPELPERETKCERR